MTSHITNVTYEGGKHITPGPPMALFGQGTDAGQPQLKLKRLPDGRFTPYNITPNPPLPDDIAFPGRDARKAAKERAAKGFKIKKVKKEIALGTITNPLVDNTAWTKPMNDHLETLSDILPRIPFVLLLFAMINSGKTTIVAQLVQIYCSRHLFKEVYIFSPTAITDPTLLTIQAQRDPECVIHLATAPDFQMFKDKADEVKALYLPYERLAMVGKYKKKEDRTLFKELQREFDNPAHPYLNADGTSHGRVPVLQRHPEFKKKTGHVPLLTSTKSDQAVNIKTRVMKARGRFPAKYQRVIDMVADITTRSHKELDSEVRQAGPRIADGDIVNYPAQLNLERPSLIEAQHQAIQSEILHTNPLKYEKMRNAKPTLIVYDDSSETFHGPAARFIRGWITTIRHSMMSLILVAHKLSVVPTIVRANATHVIISRNKNPREIEALENEYGSLFEDFPGLLEAATSEVEGRPKDFLFIDLLKGKAYRSFTGEIVPREDATGSTSDDEVIVQPLIKNVKTSTKNTRKSKEIERLSSDEEKSPRKR